MKTYYCAIIIHCETYFPNEILMRFEKNDYREYIKQC